MTMKTISGLTKSRRFKVLVCAYRCSPVRGSEYAVGWGWAESIAKYHDLWILTDEETRDEIDLELARRPELKERMNFSYIPRLQYKRLERIWKPLDNYTYKHQWQEEAYQAAIELNKKIHFDLAHQITYVGFRLPGRLWEMDIPFVWGPVGGLEQTNWKLIPHLGPSGMLFYTARNLINAWQKKYLKISQLAFAKTKKKGAVIAATQGIRDEIKKYYDVDSEVLCEVGLPPLQTRVIDKRNVTEPLRICWSGRQYHGKALNFLLDALRDIPLAINWELHILGDGPSHNHWVSLSKKYKIYDRCIWYGVLSRIDALNVMQKCHSFVITSVYDLTSTVLIEAMANGLTVICPGHCGFSDVIDDGNGIKIPTESYSALIDGLRKAIILLYEDDVLRMRMAENALQKVNEYSWERKGVVVNEIYTKLVYSH